MNYALTRSTKPGATVPFAEGARRFVPFMKGDGQRIAIAVIAITLSSLCSLYGPIIIGRTVDGYIRLHDASGLTRNALILTAIYVLGVFAQYIQVISMGSAGRRLLFRLRGALFTRLQELPVAFFNQNKAGDLISRLNNDTDKLNQFIAQALMQFMGSTFMMAGATIFLLTLNFKLGLAALAPAAASLVITKATGAWVKGRNLRSLQGIGAMSSEIQESLNNFKVIVAFNRLDYFRRKFSTANENNYNASVSAGIANNVFNPLYGLAHSLGQLAVIAYGVHLIGAREITLGMLIGYLFYVNNFYQPMRQLATVWSSFQLGLAALDRISEVLALESNLKVLPPEPARPGAVLSFRNVAFSYPDGQEVLHNITFELERGKAYALVGPTGGGKTTTASLMARLYDPTSGSVLLGGRDIRTLPHEERARRIGFILQDPVLFTGTVGENIVYGNPDFSSYSTDALQRVLAEAGVASLLDRFPEGLDTKVTNSGNSISLGQKQLIAFMRATLRKPDVLILDEATANIDTVTEQLLQDILDKLPAETTRVIIAHRLNTIENVDRIYFVNSGELVEAGSMEHAVEMLLHHKRQS